MTSEDEKKPQRNFDLMKVFKHWKSILAVTLVGLTVNSATGAPLSHERTNDDSRKPGQPAETADTNQEKPLEPTSSPTVETKPASEQILRNGETAYLGVVSLGKGKENHFELDFATLKPGQELWLVIGSAQFTSAEPTPGDSNAVLLIFTTDHIEGGRAKMNENRFGSDIFKGLPAGYQKITLRFGFQPDGTVVIYLENQGQNDVLTTAGKVETRDFNNATVENRSVTAIGNSVSGPISFTTTGLWK